MKPAGRLLDTIRESLLLGSRRGNPMSRPYVTLSYAQSIDGSIASRPGRPLALSCGEAMTFTHCLRSIHDGILVGIGTILSDNPLLTVRHVNGCSPQPIVVDGRLRFPPEARILTNPEKTPWIATAADPDSERERALAASGVKVLHIPFDQEGLVDLTVLLAHLLQMNIGSLMVEGGAQIITSFLRHRLVDQLVLTMAPVYVGGMQAVWPLQLNLSNLPRLENMAWEMCGSDLVMRADVVWREP